MPIIDARVVVSVFASNDNALSPDFYARATAKSIEIEASFFQALEPVVGGWSG